MIVSEKTPTKIYEKPKNQFSPPKKLALLSIIAFLPSNPLTSKSKKG